MVRADELQQARLLADRQLAVRRSVMGLALLASPIIGFAPLRDALLGRGPFEEAILRFLACVVVCLIAGSVLGRLLAGTPDDIVEAVDERRRRAEDEAERQRRSEGDRSGIDGVA